MAGKFSTDRQIAFTPKRSAANGFFRPFAALRIVCLALVLLQLSCGAAGAKPLKKILAIHSYHQGYSWQIGMDRAMDKAFSSQDKMDVEVFHEYMDSLRLPDSSLQIPFFDYLKSRYAGVSFDLIMATDNPALSFLLNYRDWLFGAKPVVFCGINGFRPEMLQGTRNYAGITEAVDVVGTLRVALKLWPRAKRVILFGRHSQTFYANLSRLNSAVGQMKGIELASLVGMRLPQVLEHLKKLTPDNLVLLTEPVADQDGRLTSFSHSTPMITMACPVPVFSLWDVVVGKGVVGGKVVSAGEQGRLGAELALQILGGEDPDAKSRVLRGHNRYMFDYKQLVRFGMPLSALPEDSILINKPPSIWQDYKEIILAVAGLLAFLCFLVLMLGLNIVRRKRAERSLKKSEELFRTVFEQAAVGICYCSLGGRLLRANDKFCRILGYTKKEIENISFKKITHPDDIESDIANVSRLLAGQGTQYSAQKRYINKQGDILWISLTVSLVKDELGKPDYLIAAAEDISDRKRAEKEREELETQLRQSQKMEAIGTLAGGIAHDFNNILAAIRGYTELAISRARSGEAVNHELDQVLGAVGNARELVRGILSISRKTGSLHKPLDLNRELRQAAGMLERTILRMVGVELKLCGHRLVTKGDAAQVQQLLLNLGANAKDAMPHGGTLTIETGLTELTEEFCRANPGALPGEYARISVGDTGYGMSPEIIENIFDPFFTTKETGRGTGLGLAMAYGIVKSHRGFIACKSLPEQGTTFDIYLPLAKGVEVDPVETDADGPLNQGNNETILVVDDEKALREVSEQMLGASGYRILLADCGEKAIEMYRERGADIDLVILDISMPGMGGHRCMECLLDMDPEVKIIMASGYSKDISARQAVEKGALSYLAKPFSMKELLEVIRRVLKSPGASAPPPG